MKTSFFPRWANWVLPFVFFVLFSCSTPPPPPSQNEENINPDSILTSVDTMPQFINGGDTGLLKFITENTKGAKKDVAGKVIVRFIVNKDGSISKARVTKSLDPQLDQEALRVVGLLPKFKPALQEGKPVQVWYIVPVEFKAAK